MNRRARRASLSCQQMPDSDEHSPGGRLLLDEEASAPGLSTAQFHARQFLLSLTPTERAAVATRPRFHSMPWLRPAGQDNTDELP